MYNTSFLQTYIEKLKVMLSAIAFDLSRIMLQETGGLC